MNGAEALAFVRERHALSEGDISRGRRQQAFIKALLLKSLSRDVLTNPIKLAQFVDAGTKNLTVDQGFSVGDMRVRGVLACATCAARTSPSSPRRSPASAPRRTAGRSTSSTSRACRPSATPCRTTQMSTYTDQTHTP